MRVGRQVRERGQRELQLDPQALKSLSTAAQAVQHGSTRSAYKKSDEDAPEYCLEVTQREDGTKRVAKGAAVENRMQNLIAAFDRLIDANHWVCPARASAQIAPLASLSRSAICHDSKDLAVKLNASDHSGCLIHQFDVYKGVVHYYAEKPTMQASQPGLPLTLVAEEYRELGEHDFNRVLQLVRRLKLQQEDHLGHGPFCNWLES